MNFLPENLADKAFNVKTALAELKNDVLKTLSPYALNIINQYAEKYTGLKPTDLTTALGITPEQEKAANVATPATPASAPISPTDAPTTTATPPTPAAPIVSPPPAPAAPSAGLIATPQPPTAPPTPPAAANEQSTSTPQPSSAPPNTPAANLEQPTPEALSPPLPLDRLRQQYQATATLRDTAAITGQTRSDLEKTLDFALRFAPNFIASKLAESPTTDLATLEKEGIKMDSFSPLVDLSAFSLEKLRAGTLNLKVLKEKGISELVLMEDRDPLFFLNFQNFSPNAPVPLNRHGGKNGNPAEQWTMSDLKLLTDRVHQSGMKITIGFWGNYEKAHTNPFLSRNAEALKPMIPGSSDLNPLAIVTDEQGREMCFADYVIGQYRKLNQAFQFDGLFLGDGLMGYRDFRDPNAPYDFSQTAPLWTDFYKRLHQGVHEITPEGKLWAYDVLGKSPAEALKHGVDLTAITPFVDTYIFQAYGSDAWGKDYMALPGYDLPRDQAALAALPEALKNKTKYTVSIGDSVEGWHASPQTINQKSQTLSPHAHQGGLGVWSNQAIRGIT